MLVATHYIRFGDMLHFETPKTLRVALCFAAADRGDAAAAKGDGDEAGRKRRTEPTIKNGSVRDKRGERETKS